MAIKTKDLAALCNVSRGTVDRALNNRPGVNPETRDRILEAAKEYGYIPNRVASSLVKNKTDTIGIIVFDLYNKHFVDLVSSVERVFSERGVTTYVCLSGKSREKERKLILDLASRQVDGILLVSVNYGEDFVRFIDSLNIPVIVINNRVESLPYVGGDNAQAICDAMDHMVLRGIRKTYLVCPPLRYRDSENIGAQSERAEGYEKYLHEHPEIEGGILAVGDYWEKIRQIVAESNEKVGFLCTSDHYAIKIYLAAKKEGYRLPDDFALMGFDGVDALNYLPQRIDSVDYPAEQIGTKAAEMLLEYREGIMPENCVFKCPVIDGETIIAGVLQDNRM